MSAFAHLGNILIDPAKSWPALREKTHALVPLLLVILASAATTWLYFERVDASWYIEQLINAQTDLGSEQKNAMRGMGIGMVKWPAIGGILVGMPIILCIFAVYYLLVGKTMGLNDRRFGHWYGFVVWQTWPGILSALAGAALILTAGSGEIAMTATNPTSFAYLLDIGMDSKWSGVAQGLTLVSFWGLWIGIVGFKEWSGKSAGTSAAVVLAPSIVIYGGMALWALSK